MARAENKESASPTARLVADVARKLRVRKGWTQEQLGREMGFSAAAVSAMETCAQPASDEMLVKLEQVLGDGLEIFEQARVYMRMEKYPPQFKNYAGLEQKALVVRLYATHVIHGLFQTEAYARALIGGGYPPLSEHRVEELVEARMDARHSSIESRWRQSSWCWRSPRSGGRSAARRSCGSNCSTFQGVRGGAT